MVAEITIEQTYGYFSDSCENLGISTVSRGMTMADERMRIRGLGEYYEDLLKLDAQINDRSAAEQATSLLCAKLQEREPKIVERLQYLADKRGISVSEIRTQILKGKYQKIKPEDIPDSVS